MMNVMMLISGLDEDQEILDQLRDQDVSTDDWDIIIAIPSDQVDLTAHFRRDEDGRLVCEYYDRPHGLGFGWRGRLVRRNRSRPRDLLGRREISLRNFYYGTRTETSTAGF